MKLLCYCETRLHVQIAHHLQAAGATVELMLAEWSDDVGQFELAETLRLTVRKCRAGNPTRKRLAGIRRAARDAMRTCPADALILFQDQSAPAWHVGLAARDIGLARILVQDGFLSFEPPARSPLQRLAGRLPARLWTGRPIAGRAGINLKLYDWLLKGQFFAHTRPDLAIVHGPHMARQIQRQFAIPAARIATVGPLMELADGPPRQVRLRTAGSPLRLLFLAQPSLRYSRISAQGWQAEYLPLVRCAAALGADIRLHPAQGDDEMQGIAEFAGAATILPATGPLSGRDLGAYDCIVTASSTGFLQARALGLHVITVALPSARDVIPKIDDPLICSAASLAQVQDAIATLQHTQRFPEKEGATIALNDLVANWQAPLASRLQAALEAVERVAHTRAGA